MKTVADAVLAVMMILSLAACAGATATGRTVYHGFNCAPGLMTISFMHGRHFRPFICDGVADHLKYLVHA